MKLLRTENERLLFFLTEWEKLLLIQTLEMFPLVPSTHHRLTRTSNKLVQAEDQHLLEEAVAEQREENRHRVRKFLDEPRQFAQTKAGFQLALRREEVEWLLQVLNDVRVGAWLALGEPEEIHQESREENSPIVFALEASGYFQSELLAGFGHRDPSGES